AKLCVGLGLAKLWLELAKLCVGLEIAKLTCTTDITVVLFLFPDERQKRDVPNWAMTASDFFGWVEELRKHAGYERIDDLARTFWAHFPSADRLGYGSHEPDE
uniref:Si:ch73-23l24.1 n=1 Tax=Sphaeramia orbicularis TaxID=375764 RepID=A0A673BR24_9TELE